jgi:hypothetical protein
MLTTAHERENNFGFDFLKWYHKDGDEFLNHIVWVTDDETRVSFMNVEAKNQSKHSMPTHSPNKQKNLRRIILVRHTS